MREAHLEKFTKVEHRWKFTWTFNLIQKTLSVYYSRTNIIFDNVCALTNHFHWICLCKLYMCCWFRQSDSTTKARASVRNSYRRCLEEKKTVPYNLQITKNCMCVFVRLLANSAATSGFERAIVDIVLVSPYRIRMFLYLAAT